MFYNSDKWEKIIFEGKARTYESAISAYWKLFGQAGEGNGFSSAEYYNATRKSAAAELYCTQEISDQMHQVELDLVKLSVSVGTSKERGVFQDKAGTEIEKLVHLIRNDLGLKPLKNFAEAIDDETSKALLAQWGYKGE